MDIEGWVGVCVCVCNKSSMKIESILVDVRNPDIIPH